MLGIILNSFTKINKHLDEVLSRVYPAQRHFGLNTTLDTTIPENTTVSMDSGLTSTSFNNLTISENANIVATVKHSGDTHSVIVPDNYSPLVLRCYDTLTVNGSINADGKGLHDMYASATLPFITQMYEKRVTSPGYSATEEIYRYLQQYAYGMPFFLSDRYVSPKAIKEDFYVFNESTQQNEYVRSRYIYGADPEPDTNTPYFYGTGGSNGLNGYKVGYHISAGGQYNSHAGGGSGGVVILYYEHLYAVDAYGNRMEYGIHENFPVNRICANGLGGDCGSTATYGGGCLILAARNIVLGPNGRISSNGTLADGVTQTGTNFSFLNNLPQLGRNQSGNYWDNATQTYKNGIPSDREYYFSDGTTLDICNKSATDYGLNAGDVTYCGGAGAVIGIKCSI